MRIFKYSFFFSFGLSIFSLVFSWFVSCYWSSLFVGIFSSSLLVALTSIISYLANERNEILQYYWNSVDLANKIHEYNTIRESNSSVYMQLSCIEKINEIIRRYYVFFDISNYISLRIFEQRNELFNCLLSIQEVTIELYDLSTNIEAIYRSECFKQGCSIKLTKQTLSKNETIVSFNKLLHDYHSKGSLIHYMNSTLLDALRKLLNQ